VFGDDSQRDAVRPAVEDDHEAVFALLQQIVDFGERSVFGTFGNAGGNDIPYLHKFFFRLRADTLRTISTHFSRCLTCNAEVLQE
jgi:hypothetical protein